jgi:hypothetical protein
MFLYSIILAGSFGFCCCWMFWMLLLVLDFFLQDVYDNLLVIVYAGYANVYVC